MTIPISVMDALYLQDPWNGLIGNNEPFIRTKLEYQAEKFLIISSQI